CLVEFAVAISNGRNALDTKAPLTQVAGLQGRCRCPLAILKRLIQLAEDELVNGIAGKGDLLDARVLSLLRDGGGAPVIRCGKPIRLAKIQNETQGSETPAHAWQEITPLGTIQ